MSTDIEDDAPQKNSSSTSESHETKTGILYNNDNQYDILPCCHCGGDMMHLISIDILHVAVRCCGCGTIGPPSLHEKGAVDWWNTRMKKDTY